tara:strand:+ start:2821 stop:3879 length:1059 start_codon:yes stop_codon:yes gene_type:complete
MKNFYLLIIISAILILTFNIYLSIVIRKFIFLTKIRNSLIYLVSSLFLFIFLDFYVYKFLGHGFPSSISEELYERAPSPYDMFAGKPNYNDHNSDGFRGNEFVNYEKDTLQIAFFGGSTGYNGNPPISNIIQKNLEPKFKVKTYNFSSVSSNHNQHLHRLLKYSNLKFDLVIFYGGFNETIQTYLYDPRPGFPFNYWIRNELDKINYLLLKYSSIYAEYEKYTGKISNLHNIKKDVNYLDDVWLDKLIYNYEQTLLKANSLSKNFINSNLCQSTNFVAFLQPISKLKSDNFSKKIISKINEHFINKEILIDLSNLVDESVFKDSVHINQDAKFIISDFITEYINKNFLDNCN